MWLSSWSCGTNFNSASNVDSIQNVSLKCCTLFTKYLFFLKVLNRVGKKHYARSLLSGPSLFLVTWQHHSPLFSFCGAWPDDLHWLMNCNTRHYCRDEAYKGWCVIPRALFRNLHHCCHSKQWHLCQPSPREWMNSTPLLPQARTKSP